MLINVVMVFASYRITRFLISDTLIDEPRGWVLTKIWGDGGLRRKLHELLTCPICLSVWISAGVVAVTNHWVSIPVPWITWLGVCGGVLLLWRWIEE